MNNPIPLKAVPVSGTAPTGAVPVEVYDLPTGGGSTAWADVTGKPATFPPAIGATATTAAAGNHVHAVANITGLQAALDAKATAAALTALTARVAALETP